MWPEGHRLIAVGAYRDGAAQLAALLGAHLDDVSGACDGTLTPSFASGITIVFDTAATTSSTQQPPRELPDTRWRPAHCRVGPCRVHLRLCSLNVAQCSLTAAHVGSALPLWLPRLPWSKISRHCFEQVGQKV